MQGLILDLRNNPGGLLDEAVKLCGFICRSGAGSGPNAGAGLESTFTSSTESPAFYQGPLVSSAKIMEVVPVPRKLLPVALQDYDRAVLGGVGRVIFIFYGGAILW